MEEEVTDGGVLSSHEFALEQRFSWRTEEERHLLDKALERAVEEDIALRSSDGHVLRCHRCVLAAASPYFSAMFKSGMRECRGQVDLHFSGQTLASLIQYLYDGRLDVSDATFEQTFRMSHLFELRSMLAYLDDVLADSTEPENAHEFFEMAIDFDIPRLRLSVIRLLLAEPILETQFEKFSIELLALLLDSDDLRVDHEGQVIELIISWVKADPATRRPHQEDLLGLVRLPHLRLTEVDAWRTELSVLELFGVLTASTDWLADVDKKMLTKRRHSNIHLHGFWAEDSLCEYNFEMMRARGVEQPLWMFDTSQYFMVCSFLGKEPKTELESCNQDYLSCTTLDGLIVREDWTKRPSFVVGPDLHISYHDTLRRVADMKGGWGSPDYDLAFLKVPLAANGLTSRRGQCKRRSFNFEYFKSRICCATEYKDDIIFVIGAFTDSDDGPELFFIRICRFNPCVDVHYDDDVECLTDELELFREYMPICCVATENDKLAVVSCHDIKVFDLSDASQSVNLEFSISFEFDIGVTAWVRQDILYVYLVDRTKDVFGGVDEQDEREPPKMHFLSGYSITKSFDKMFQHRLDFAEIDIGYPKDVRAVVIRDTTYIIYKAIPKYNSPADEALFVYRYDEDFETLVRVDRFDVLRKAANARFPTHGVLYERDLVTLLPTDMSPCEHTTLLEDHCRRCSLDEEAAYDPLRLSQLRKYLL